MTERSLEEAMKLALEALEESLGYVQEEAENAQRLYGQYPTRQARIQGLKDDARKHMDAITALREALASEAIEQPAQQQEPVVRLTVPESHTGLITSTMSGADKLPPGEYVCYTSPPANANAGKPWVELDHDDIHALMNEYFYGGMQPSGAHFANFAKAIETKLREKNT